MTDSVVLLAPAAERDIAEDPLRRRADENGDRRNVLKHFPYSVVYEIIGKTVTVLAEAHHRRRPNYWRADKP